MLSRIAQRYNTTVAELARLNNIANINKIYAGQQLQIGGNMAPTQPATGNANLAGFTIPTPTARTSFEELLPYQKVFNQQLITGLAESQINPEMARQSRLALQQLSGNLGSSGAYRTGRGAESVTNLQDSLERQRREQVQGFTDQIGAYTTDWYNKQKDNYYKNPSAFVQPTLPTFDQFVQQNPGLANAYNTQTNVNTTYTNPFNY